MAEVRPRESPRETLRESRSEPPDDQDSVLEMSNSELQETHLA